MSTDKTLATAKHGGCVKLRDWHSLAEHITDHLCANDYDIGGRPELLACVVEAISSNDRNQFEAWARNNGYTLTRAADGEYCVIHVRNLWAEWNRHALSAQPSPGGQDALLESLVARWRNHAEEIGISDNLLCQKIANCTMRHAEELQAVLAARQPVGEPVGYATFRDGRFGSWLFQTRAMAESHDSTAVAGGPANSEIVPLFRSPAQAVDLGQLPRVIELLSNVSRTLVDWAADEQREAIGIVKALIDSQAVGNG